MLEAWATQQVLDQPGLQSKTLSKKQTNKNNPQPITNNQNRMRRKEVIMGQRGKGEGPNAEDKLGNGIDHISVPDTMPK